MRVCFLVGLLAVACAGAQTKNPTPSLTPHPDCEVGATLPDYQTVSTNSGWACAELDDASAAGEMEVSVMCDDKRQPSMYEWRRGDEIVRCKREGI